MNSSETSLSVIQSAADKLQEHRAVWQSNPVLRTVYGHYYDKLLKWCPANCDRVIELGGGIGNFKERLPQAVLTDVVPTLWIDMVMDAHHQPFGDESLDAIVMIDVLHHLKTPTQFFKEALRSLRPQGRLLILDVYISALSYLVLKWFHPEPVDFSEDFWSKQGLGAQEEDPWDANQAMATVLFWKDLPRFLKTYPELKVINRERFDWCWPLSGGFSYPALVPAFCGPWLNQIAEWNWLNRLGAFRSFVVLEKQGR